MHCCFDGTCHGVTVREVLARQHHGVWTSALQINPFMTYPGSGVLLRDEKQTASVWKFSETNSPETEIHYVAEDQFSTLERKHLLSLSRVTLLY